MLDDVKFMLKKTIRTEKQYDGEKLAYGVLVRGDDDYTFFRDAFVDNRVSLATASELKWNEEQQKQRIHTNSSVPFWGHPHTDYNTQTKNVNTEPPLIVCTDGMPCCAGQYSKFCF